MKFPKRTLALILAVLMLTAALSACSGGKQGETQTETDPTPQSGNAEGANIGEPVMGGDLRVGIAQDLDDTFDPHNIISAGTREVLFNIYEGLVKPDNDGNLVPAVAESVDISEAGDSFTFTLREGVKFHNGETVTAEDVVYSVSRAAGLGADKPMIDGMQIITSVEATDEKTVVVTLGEPNIEMLALLTAGIIPAGSDPAVETVGTGPFKFVSRIPQESIVIEKFDEYWGTPAYVDSVTYKIIDSGETIVMSLKSGALDLVAHLTSAQVNELGDDFTVLDGTMNLVQAVYLNNAVEPFNDVKVRQALAHAIDRQLIMDFLAEGRGAAVGSSMYPAFEKYFVPELVDEYSYDPELAKQLLADAGYPDGFSFDCTVPSNYQPHIDTAEVVAQELQAVGVSMNIKLVDWETWLSETYLGRNYQATIVGVDAAMMTARAMLERFTSDAGNNFVNFSSAEYDETFAAAISCTHDAEQTELYKKLQTILAEEAANLYIQDLCDLVAMRKGVGGYEFYPIYVMDMSKVYFTN